MPAGDIGSLLVSKAPRKFTLVPDFTLGDRLDLVLRPGGVLLYATCSILAAENADQVQAFLERTPDARAAVLPEAFGHPAGPGRQRLPGEGGMDGFFYARLQKSD